MKTVEMDIEKITKRLEEEGCRVLTEDELRLQVNGGWGRSSSSSSSSSRSSSSSSRGSSSSGGSSSRSSGSSGRNSSGASKKSESGATKTKTSFGQSIKNFAEKYASSNWQKNHPDFGAHSSRSSNNGNNGYNGGSYNRNGNGAKADGKDGTESSAGSEEAKAGENTTANGTAPATAKASAPQPKSQKRETFSYKTAGNVNQNSKIYTKSQTFIPKTQIEILPPDGNKTENGKISFGAINKVTPYYENPKFYDSEKAQEHLFNKKLQGNSDVGIYYHANQNVSIGIAANVFFNSGSSKVSKNFNYSEREIKPIFEFSLGGVNELGINSISGGVKIKW